MQSGLGLVAQQACSVSLFRGRGAVNPSQSLEGWLLEVQIAEVKKAWNRKVSRRLLEQTREVYQT